ncbi:hypothetical protein Tco_1234498 [Tanacetum coccineum]
MPKSKPLWMPFDDLNAVLAHCQGKKDRHLKDVEDSSRPMRSITTLKPLPSIDPKDKGNEFQEKMQAREEASEVATMNCLNEVQEDDPQKDLKNKGIIDSGCSRHITRNQNSINLTDMEQSASTTGSLEADESSRWIKTFSKMVTMFDRLDLEELYNLVMQRFESTTPEGVDLVLWGDLRTMFDANTEDELWQNQERWNLKSWNFYENCGVHTLTLEDGTEIHMLAERKYPLTKETLERMMSLKLIAESASESAYNLLRFIQKQIDEYGSYDGSEKDL